MKLKRKIYKGFIYFIALVWLFVVLFPVYWMFLTSIRDELEVYNTDLYTTSPTLTNYIDVLFQRSHWTSEFWLQFMNTLFVSLSTSFLVMIISSMTGFALARLKFKGRGLVSRILLGVYILPYAFLVLPFYALMRFYGLIDNLISVVIAMTSFSLPFTTWVLRTYYNSIPREIEEAALIDGANRIKLLTTIYLPISAPALLAIMAYAFIRAWNEYLYVVVLINSFDKVTLPVALTSLLTSDLVPWGLVMAYSIIYAIPPVVFYLIFHKYLFLKL